MPSQQKLYDVEYYIIDNDVILAGLVTVRTILDQDFGPLSLDLYHLSQHEYLNSSRLIYRRLEARQDFRKQAQILHDIGQFYEGN